MQSRPIAATKLTPAALCATVTIDFTHNHHAYFAGLGTVTVPTVVKYGGRSMAKLLMPLFTAVWGAAALAPRWTTGVTQYFHKAGEPSSMGNYRGITLLDVVSKLFHKVLANRLVNGTLRAMACCTRPRMPSGVAAPRMTMCTASVRSSKAGSAVGSQRTHSSWISARRMIQCGGMGCCISCGIRASGGRSGRAYAPCTPVLPARSDEVTPRLPRCTVIWAWHRGIPSHVCCLTLSQSQMSH
jgi:hypothetical protein